MPGREPKPVNDDAPIGGGKRAWRGKVQGMGLAAVALGLVAWYFSRVLGWVGLDPGLVRGVAGAALPMFAVGAVVFWVGSLMPRRRAAPPPSKRL